jgi:AMMECR1 domain-containing protein
MLTNSKGFKMPAVSMISELRGLYRKCSQRKDNKTQYFEASFFSTGNLSSQTIERIAT